MSFKDKKILITGANGFVGSRLMNYFDNAIASPSLRNSTQKDISGIIDSSGADIIIHTAAISDIGDCKNDPEASYQANVMIPIYLANASAGKKLICFSSDQVYSGCTNDGPYTEDTVSPANIYAKHKLEMEEKVLKIKPDAILLRAEWMFDYNEVKGNFYMNILSAKSSFETTSKQYRGVTYIKEVCENMTKVIELPGGVYNYGSETTKSIYDIAVEFANKLSLDIDIIDNKADYHNLWIDTSKAKKYGINFSTAEDALIRCAKDYKLIK